MKKIAYLFFIGMLISGCATAPSPRIHNNKLMTEIISDPPGAKIEINSQYVGETPLTLNIYRACSYFGWDSFSIKANHVLPGQYTQVKYIDFNEPTPTKVYFNMNLSPVRVEVNVNK